MSSRVLFTTSQKTLPTYPSSSQSQLKLLNMGVNPVKVTLPGVGPVVLPANQVCLHIGNTKYQRDWALQVYNSAKKKKKSSAMQSCLPSWHGLYLTGQWWLLHIWRGKYNNFSRQPWSASKDFFGHGTAPHASHSFKHHCAIPLGELQSVWWGTHTFLKKTFNQHFISSDWWFDIQTRKRQKCSQVSLNINH